MDDDRRTAYREGQIARRKHVAAGISDPEGAARENGYAGSRWRGTFLQGYHRG